MKRICLAIIGLFAGILTTTAQNTPPVVTSQIADFTQYATTQRSIDLTSAFADSDVSDAVRMNTVLGNIDVALFGHQKPITVANFLNYVNQGRYFKVDPTNGQLASSFIHRGFNSPNIIQGGGYLGTVLPNPGSGVPADAVQPTAVLSFPPIQNEFGISNKRGTIAMAKVGGNPNSATSQWFINVNDNASLDDPANNGGYTVFGRVVSGLSVVDAIFALPRYNAGGAFTDFPLRNYSPANYVRIPNLISIPDLSQISTLTFSATSNNGNVTAAVSGSTLLVTANQVGSSTVTVTATDLDGATVSQNFTVSVVTAPGRLVNLSTRMQVGTGDNALIAGFIMRGPASKRLLIRALGPSLTAFGIPNAVADPTLELHDSSGATLATNDNWGDASNHSDVSNVGLAPTAAAESAILTTVPSSDNGVAYTAILRGANNTTGVGLVEVYDLDSGPGSTLLNISTRGQVGVDPNALIGGFTLGGSESKQILIRAIGPSLTQFGVPNALGDPTLDLANAQGTTIVSNDNWMDSPQKMQIQASGLAPTDVKESAVLQTLTAGQYTAVVHGVSNGSGVGSVQIYQLN
jgi:cyclophilin family peptidyl-prolyl cis-trans isomerase